MNINFKPLQNDIYHIVDTMKHKAEILKRYSVLLSRIEENPDNLLTLLLDLENAPLDTSAIKFAHYENATEVIAQEEAKIPLLNRLRENDQLIYYKFCEESQIPEFTLETHQKHRLILSILNTNLCMHDDSKLFNYKEYEIYKEVVPKFEGKEYGTPEHKKVSDELEEGFKLHIQENPHHPEHFDMDISKMSLFSILEMTLDWCAACTCRGFKLKMSTVNEKKEKLKLDDEIINLIKNTIRLCLDKSQIVED